MGRQNRKTKNENNAWFLFFDFGRAPALSMENSKIDDVKSKTNFASRFQALRPVWWLKTEKQKVFSGFVVFLKLSP